MKTRNNGLVSLNGNITNKIVAKTKPTRGKKRKEAIKDESYRESHNIGRRKSTSSVVTYSLDSRLFFDVYAKFNNETFPKERNVYNGIYNRSFPLKNKAAKKLSVSPNSHSAVLPVKRQIQSDTVSEADSTGNEVDASKRPFKMLKVSHEAKPINRDEACIPSPKLPSGSPIKYPKFKSMKKMNSKINHSNEGRIIFTRNSRLQDESIGSSIRAGGSSEPQSKLTKNETFQRLLENKTIFKKHLSQRIKDTKQPVDKTQKPASVTPPRKRRLSLRLNKSLSESEMAKLPAETTSPTANEAKGKEMSRRADSEERDASSPRRGKRIASLNAAAIINCVQNLFSEPPTKRSPRRRISKTEETVKALRHADPDIVSPDAPEESRERHTGTTNEKNKREGLMQEKSKDRQKKDHRSEKDDKEMKRFVYERKKVLEINEKETAKKKVQKENKDKKETEKKENKIAEMGKKGQKERNNKKQENKTNEKEIEKENKDKKVEKEKRGKEKEIEIKEKKGDKEKEEKKKTKENQEREEKEKEETKRRKENQEKRGEKEQVLKKGEKENHIRKVVDKENQAKKSEKENQIKKVDKENKHKKNFKKDEVKGKENNERKSGDCNENEAAEVDVGTVEKREEKENKRNKSVERDARDSGSEKQQQQQQQQRGSASKEKKRSAASEDDRENDYRKSKPKRSTASGTVLEKFFDITTVSKRQYQQRPQPAKKHARPNSGRKAGPHVLVSPGRPVAASHDDEAATEGRSLWQWEGASFRKAIKVQLDAPCLERTCYSAIRHSRDDIVITTTDCVMLRSSADQEPFLAKISAFYLDEESGKKMMTLLWYYRPEHTELGRLAWHTEWDVYASRHLDNNSVDCIEDKAFVLPVELYSRFVAFQKRQSAGTRPGLAARLISVSNDDILKTEPDENKQGQHLGDPTANMFISSLYYTMNYQNSFPTEMTSSNVFVCRGLYDIFQQKVTRNILQAMQTPPAEGAEGKAECHSVDSAMSISSCDTEPVTKLEPVDSPARLAPVASLAPTAALAAVPDAESPPASAPVPAGTPPPAAGEAARVPLSGIPMPCGSAPPRVAMDTASEAGADKTALSSCLSAGAVGIPSNNLLHRGHGNADTNSAGAPGNNTIAGGSVLSLVSMPIRLPEAGALPDADQAVARPRPVLMATVDKAESVAPSCSPVAAPPPVLPVAAAVAKETGGAARSVAVAPAAPRQPPALRALALAPAATRAAQPAMKPLLPTLPLASRTGGAPPPRAGELESPSRPPPIATANGTVTVVPVRTVFLHHPPHQQQPPPFQNLQHRQPNGHP